MQTKEVVKHITKVVRMGAAAGLFLVANTAGAVSGESNKTAVPPCPPVPTGLPSACEGDGCTFVMFRREGSQCPNTFIDKMGKESGIVIKSGARLNAGDLPPGVWMDMGNGWSVCGSPCWK